MKEDYILSEHRAVQDFLEYGAIKVPFSGALPGDKLDIELTELKLAGYRISNKYTNKKSFSIKLDDWEKDKKQAQLCGSKFFRRIELEDPLTGKLTKIICIDQDLFQELLLNEEEKA